MASVAAKPAIVRPDSETFLETKEPTVFEWHMKGVKALFEASEGISNYPSLESELFEGRWLLRFYASEADDFCGAYLQSISTQEEQDLLRNRGRYSVRFEMRSLDKQTCYYKEGLGEVVFKPETKAWGFDDFVSRRALYGKGTGARKEDGFVLMCFVSSCGESSPRPPSPASRTVSLNLLNAYSALFDKPEMSDVTFVVKEGGTSKEIHAIKALLEARTDYFASMFTSGFAESYPAPEASESAKELPVPDADPNVSLKRTSGCDEVDSSNKRQRTSNGGKRTEVVITDTSYNTMRAVLFYIYTERVAFYPLASSPSKPGARGPADGGAPCVSSHQAYIAADKMGIDSLKKKAYDFIITHLSVENIAHQIFGSFTQQYPEFKKPEMKFFLGNWAEVRETNGYKEAVEDRDKYPGFVEMFGYISKLLTYPGSGQSSARVPRPIGAPALERTPQPPPPIRRR